MREIKFRAWDKKSKIMLTSECDGLVIHFDGLLNSLDENYEIVGTDNTRQLELMQFTGLHDKNGKEIYEGDIVSAFDGKIKAKITYSHCSFELEWMDTKTSSIRGSKSEPIFKNVSIIFEVISNIHEGGEPNA